MGKLISLVVVFVFFAAGCSGGSSESGSQQPESNSQVPTASPESALRPTPQAKPTSEPTPTTKPAVTPESTTKSEPIATSEPNRTPEPTPTPQPAAPAEVTDLTISLVSKAFVFNWSAIDDVTHYRLLENESGASGYTQVGVDIAATVQAYKHTVPLHFRVNAEYILQSCTDSVCTDSTELAISGNLADAIGVLGRSVVGSISPSISLSSDGDTLAIGATNHEGRDTGPSADEDDTLSGIRRNGAVYVFTLNEGLWVQETFIKSDVYANDVTYYGISVDLSSDGNTLAVGASREGAGGRAYIYIRVEGKWFVDGAFGGEERSGGQFGAVVSLSGDGRLVAISDARDGSRNPGVNNRGSSISGGDSGAAYVFERVSGEWEQQAFIKPSIVVDGEHFGSTLALSEDGSTLVVVGKSRSSLYVFYRRDSAWTESYSYAGTISASGPQSIALSGDGSMVAIKRVSQISGERAESVQVFEYDGVDWSVSDEVFPPSRYENDNYGYTLELSSDGKVLAVASINDDTTSEGLRGDPNDNSGESSGSVHVYRLESGSWVYKAYVRPPEYVGSRGFGRGLSLDANGSSLAVYRTPGSGNSSATVFFY